MINTTSPSERRRSNLVAQAYSAAGKIDYCNQKYRYDQDCTKPDHPQLIVIVILQPDEHSHGHVDDQQNDGNGLEHCFRKGAPIPVNFYLQKCLALILRV